MNWIGSPTARIPLPARRGRESVSPGRRRRPRPLLPGALRRHLDQLGGMAALAGQTCLALARPPFVWRRQFVIQCIFILRAAFLPIAISIAAWGFSGPGLQAGNFLATLGSVDRSGGFMVVAIIREFGTFVTATVVAGIVGTTITAELGTRVIREELDALRTMGVDPISYIVAPRVLALVVMMVVLTMFALVCGVFGGYVASVGVLGATTGSFLHNFFANTTAVDLVAGVIKVAIFGALIGIVCCYKGLRASGGPEGVGRAVNEAVVGCLVAIFFVNLVYTQWFLAAYPQVGVLR